MTLGFYRDGVVVKLLSDASLEHLPARGGTGFGTVV
jgi:hypothetical protein